MTTKEKEPKKKVVRSYSIKYEEYEDGTNSLKRVNRGVNFYLLLGILDITREELHDMFRGETEVKVDVIERTYVKE